MELRSARDDRCRFIVRRASRRRGAPATELLDSHAQRMPAGAWRIRWPARCGRRPLPARWSSSSCMPPAPKRWRDVLIDALAEATGCAAVYERSNVDVRSARRPGAARPGPLRGTMPPERRACSRTVSASSSMSSHGQKTGFYLDQRDNRRRMRALAIGPRRAELLLLHRRLHRRCAGGRRTVGAGRSTARPKRWRRHAENVARERASILTRTVHGAMPTCSPSCASCATRAKTFDLIVLDPPKFAPTARHMEKAARAYKDVNLLALKLAAPGRSAGDVLLLGRHIGRSCFRKSSPAPRWTPGRTRWSSDAFAASAPIIPWR